MDEPRDLAAELAGLESAEDFLRHFSVPFDPAVVEVKRLHILQRFHDYLARRGAAPGSDAARECLARAYDDFVHSDALTEKVFRVFERAAGISRVPLSAIRRGGEA